MISWFHLIAYDQNAFITSYAGNREFANLTLQDLDGNYVHLLFNSVRASAYLKLWFKIDRFEMHEVKAIVGLQVPSFQHLWHNHISNTEVTKLSKEYVI